MLHASHKTHQQVNNWHFDLRKRHEYLSKIMIAIGWEYEPNNAFDLDLICFLLGADHKLLSKDHFIFYNNLRSPDGAVEHSGDNSNGMGDGADEIIYVDLDQLDHQVEEMVFSVIINKATSRDQMFGLMSDAFVTIEEVENQQQLMTYRLDTEFPCATGVDLGRLVRTETGWDFKSDGKCTDSDLDHYLSVYAQA